VIDIIFQHRDSTGKNTVARRTAYRLCEYFAHANPALATFVDEVVADSGFDTTFDISALAWFADDSSPRACSARRDSMRWRWQWDASAPATPSIASDSACPATDPARRPHDSEAPAGYDAQVRLAAIDLGTNSVHMVVANVTPDGRIEVIDRVKEMVRLGQR